MFVIDGNNISGQQRFWKAGDNGGGVCNLTVGETYSFSYWIRTVSYTVSGNNELADIGVSFNNATNISITFGTTLAPIPNFGWLQVRYLFTATNPCVNIEMFNNNTSSIGNDFAIDDIRLTRAFAPLDFTYSVTKSNCSDTNSGLITFYPNGGTEPYSFTLLNTQNQELTNTNGIFEFLQDDSYTLIISDNAGASDTIENVVLSTISTLQVTPSDTSICPSDSLIIQVTGGNGSYIWTSNNPFETGFPDSTSSITVNPTINTVYEVSSSITNSNIIFNGDFQLGNLGFGTAYSFYGSSNPNPVSRGYGVLTNPNNWNSGYSSCIDHTIGDGTGKMMVIDGSTFNLGNDPFWCQAVAVEPNKDYLFSYWATSLTNTSVAVIEVQINGITLGNNSVANQNCSWEQINYVWNSGNNTIAEVCLFDMNYQEVGNDFAIDDIVFQSQNNCTEQVLVTMANINPNYDVSYPTYGCINDSLINPVYGPDYISGGYYNILQSGLDLNPSTGVIAPFSSIPGNYQITYTANVCGSFIPDTLDFQLKSLPASVELTGGTYHCESQEFNSVLLTVSGSPDFQVFYSINDSIQIATSNSNQINLGNIPGVYTLDSISDLYCSNTLQGMLTIDSANAPVIPIIQGDSTYCYNAVIQPLFVQNVSDGIRWYGDSSLTNFLGSNVTILPDNQNSQTYYATQTVNGCEGLAGEFAIYINSWDLIIPSAFTPNNDGQNDLWSIYGLDTQYPNNVVRVFNRWGELLYESLPGTYSSKPWNGKYKEEKLPVGTYYYVIELSKDKKDKPLNGIVSIILKN